MKIKQKHICKRYGLSPAIVSLTLSGKRAVSWPWAIKLAEDFPGKTVVQWKEATPEDLKRAFAQHEEA
jgi:hypothetical protein